MLNKVFNSLFLFMTVLITYSCSILPFGNSNPSARNPGTTSTTTNLEYFSDAFAEDEDGFVVAGFDGQTPGPNQIFVQGGRAVLGTYEEDVFFTHDNVERTVTVQSFYLDQTEIANIHWLEYLFYIEKDSSEARISVMMVMIRDRCTASNLGILISFRVAPASLRTGNMFFTTFATSGFE